MGDALIYLEPGSDLGLQDQIRQKLVEGIVSGAFAPGSRLPSSRRLATQLGVARNTVVLAYEQLIDEGLLESRQRSGIFVANQLLESRVGYSGRPAADIPLDEDWRQRIRRPAPDPGAFAVPANWHRHPYPFVDGLYDASLYPTQQWREASRLALGLREIQEGSAADVLSDDAALVEEIRTKMLPRRGITAAADEILITLGHQNALFLVSQLLANNGTRVAMEEPGNPRFRALAQHAGAHVCGQPIDECGMVINRRLARADLVYVTPSHQVPTAVTMPNARREALLKQAVARDQLIIEDDIEHENNYLGQPHPALRGMDTDQRVIYVSGLPGVLAPGLRIGFVVAHRALIREARRLRHQIVGRPSLVQQRTAALFLSLGHYDACMARLHRVLGARWDALRQALNHYYRGHEISLPTSGGTALWVECPKAVDIARLVDAAARRGILIEPDTPYYGDDGPSRHHFRLGVTGIPEDRIREGVERLQQLILELSGDTVERITDQTPGLQSGARLKERLPGAVLHYRTFYSVPCTIELHPDGRMVGRSGHADEDCDEGRWWVEDGLYCRQWNQWGYGEVGRYQVTIEDDQIRWWRPGGRLVDDAIIEWPRR